MLTTGTQDLLEPLAQAQAAYHDGTARLAPASADRLARRVEHFASSVQFVLDAPDAARHLHALTKDLHLVRRLGTLLPQVLRGAMEDVHSICGRTARQGALHLGRPSGDGPGDPVGRALITALLDPARVREPDVSVPFELWVMRRMTVGHTHWVGPAGGAPSLPDGGRSP